MGLNKLEKEIKKQLDQREIVPTQAAWDRLDAMLTVAEEKKVKPIYNWLYIAASLIGFAAIGYVFFSNPQSVVDSKREEIVTIEKTPEKELDSVHREMPIPVVTAPDQEVVQSNVKEEKKLKNSDASPVKGNKLNFEKVRPVENTAIANLEPERNKVKSNNVSMEPGSIKNDNLTENEMIAHVAAPEKQIAAADSQLKSPKIKVDASYLLSEVDTELERSFRERVIRKIDKNFQTVKVALANRNQLPE